MTKVDINITVGGPQGGGIDTSSNMISRAFAQSGYYVFGVREYHSNIKGRHRYILPEHCHRIIPCKDQQKCSKLSPNCSSRTENINWWRVNHRPSNSNNKRFHEIHSSKLYSIINFLIHAIGREAVKKIWISWNRLLFLLEGRWLTLHQLMLSTSKNFQK